MIGRQPDSTIVYVNLDSELAFEQSLRFDLALMEANFLGVNQMAKSPTLPIERVETKNFLLRNEKVLLDADLAEMYGVTTGALNQAVQRNIDRFPSDFVFQLTADEFTRTSRR